MCFTYHRSITKSKWHRINITTVSTTCCFWSAPPKATKSTCHWPRYTISLNCLSQVLQVEPSSYRLCWEEGQQGFLRACIEGHMSTASVPETSDPRHEFHFLICFEAISGWWSWHFFFQIILEATFCKIKARHQWRCQGTRFLRTSHNWF